MGTKGRPLGIERLGDMSWGTHFCLFYETERDLLETLSLYFKTGLANNEYCLWITPESFDKARNALIQAIPLADQHLKAGNLEVISYQEWYFEGGIYDATKSIQGFDTKLAQALEKGYTRMRVLADESWLDQEYWKVFIDYEGKLDKRFTGKPISIVCAYLTVARSAADILDVAQTHRFVAAKRRGKWVILEAPELKQVKVESEIFDEDQIQERTADLRRMIQALQAEIVEHRRSEESLRVSEARLQAAIDATNIGLWDWDLISGQIIWLGHLARLFGLAPDEFEGTYPGFEKRIHPEDREGLSRVLQRAREERSEAAYEYRAIWPDGSIHWIAGLGRFIYNEVDQPVRMYGAVYDITARKQAEAERERLFNELKQSHQQQRTLTRRLVEVQETERQALTAELHDRVGQNLTGLSINLQNMKALLPSKTALRLAAKFDDVQALIEDTTRQIRDIMEQLHPPELEDYGLAAALEIYAERATSRGNLELVAGLPDLAPPPLPPYVRIALFRAAQEAINNALKHADATQLEVSLEERDGRIRLRVEDNGRGFEPDSAFQKKTQTWGLKIMRERIESIGGRVQIESRPGKGTRVIFEIQRPP
jgi:PAS domain S-box-containing protein